MTAGLSLHASQRSCCLGLMCRCVVLSGAVPGPVAQVVSSYLVLCLDLLRRLRRMCIICHGDGEGRTRKLLLTGLTLLAWLLCHSHTESVVCTPDTPDTPGCKMSPWWQLGSPYGTPQHMDPACVLPATSDETDTSIKVLRSPCESGGRPGYCATVTQSQLYASPTPLNAAC